MKYNIKKRYFSIAIFFITGFLFRVFLFLKFPQPFVYDQVGYYGISKSVLENIIFTDSYRGYGYPLIIAISNFLFGSDNQNIFRLIQAMMDSSTALLILFIARRIFNNAKAAIFSYLIYLANPFTSAYAGVFLTEISIIFFITLSFYLLANFRENLTYKKMILVGLIFGFLPQIRAEFVIFSLSFLFIYIFFVLKTSISINFKRHFISILLFFYLIPFIYSAVANYKSYNKFSIFPVDNPFLKEFYISLYIEKSGPVNENFSMNYPPKIYDIYDDYSKSLNYEERKIRDKKYINLIIEEIKSDPKKFSEWRLKKLWHVWQKSYLFPYIPESNDNIYLKAISGINQLLILCGICGIFFWVKTTYRNSPYRIKITGIYIVIFLIFLTLSHAFTQALERYTLPGYPFICLFAGFFIWTIFKGQFLEAEISF